jgi:hypothetical protein
MDRLAKLRQSYQGVNGGTGFWARVDAGADETYENRIKGQSLTDLDAAVTSAKFGAQSNISKWFDLHHSYLSTSTAGAEPGLGLAAPLWESFLATVGWRVPYEWAELYYDKTGVRIRSEYIFANGTWAANIADNATAGLHKFGASLRAAGAWTFTAAEGALPTTVKGAPIIIVSNGGSTATAASITATCQDRAATKTISVAAAGGAFAADTQQVIGEQALTGNADAGQKIVAVAATAQFTAGDWVLLVDSDGVTELCQVDTIQANTSLTMETNLINAFTTAKTSVVWPLFGSAAIAGVTGGTNDDSVEIYARPDRAIAL